jgi:guanylate kinase
MKKKIILFGRSGTGKDYLIDCFGLKKVKSYTTRLKRFNEFLMPDEQLTHTFITEDEFYELEKTQVFIAKDNIYGNWYGATEEMMEESDVYLIDPDNIFSVELHYGKETFKKKFQVVNVRASYWKRYDNMMSREDTSTVKKWWQARKKVMDRLKKDKELFKNEVKVANQFNAKIINMG